MSNQSERKLRRVCAGTPVHYGQTVTEEDPASVQGYTGTLWANSQGGGCGECARVHRYTMGKQSGPCHGFAPWRPACPPVGTLVYYEQTVRGQVQPCHGFAPWRPACPLSGTLVHYEQTVRVQVQRCHGFAPWRPACPQSGTLVHYEQTVRVQVQPCHGFAPWRHICPSAGPRGR